MRRWGLSWLLLSVTTLALTACGGAADVAVEEVAEPAPATSAAPEPTPAAPATPEPAPAEGEAGTDQPDSAPDRTPAEPPPPDPAGEVTDTADTDGPAPPASSEDQQAGSADAGPTARGDGAVRDVTARDQGRAEDREPAAPAGLPAIVIERPVAGSQHGGGPVTASGQATVYEGTVLLTLVGPDGSVVEEAFTTASAGAPERGRWSHTFATAAESPGRWQVVAAATDPSDGEGRPPARTTTAFLVGGSG